MHPRPIDRIVAYVRVSTACQERSGLGREAQREAMDRFAAEGGATVVGRFTEVENGRKAARPRLTKALHLSKIICVALVVAKLDRLSRNAAFLLTLRGMADGLNERAIRTHRGGAMAGVESPRASRPIRVQQTSTPRPAEGRESAAFGVATTNHDPHAFEAAAREVGTLGFRLTRVPPRLHEYRSRSRPRAEPPLAGHRARLHVGIAATLYPRRDEWPRGRR